MLFITAEEWGVPAGQYEPFVEDTKTFGSHQGEILHSATSRGLEGAIRKDMSPVTVSPCCNFVRKILLPKISQNAWNNISDWWFRFSMFHPIWDDPNWLSYFGDGWWKTINHTRSLHPYFHKPQQSWDLWMSPQTRQFIAFAPSHCWILLAFFRSHGLSTWISHGISQIPSGKLSHNYGKSPFLMGKSTINGHFQ